MQNLRARFRENSSMFLAELGIEPGFYQSIDEIVRATNHLKSLPEEELTIEEKRLIQKWEEMKAPG